MRNGWPILLCFHLFLTVPSLVRGNDEPVDPEKAAKVKAGYLYNFTKFVTWPEKTFARPDAPLVIAIVGQSQIDEILKEAVEGKAVQGHPIQLRVFESYDEKAREALREFHMLFLTGNERQADILKDVKGRSVLTVSDTAGFAENGGMIELFLKERSIAMRVNAKAAQAEKLSISSKLLRLAEVIESPKEK